MSNANKRRKSFRPTASINYDEDRDDHVHRSAHEQHLIDRRMQRFNERKRKSPVHDAFLDQDYFGKPVSLTYKGRSTINTDLGATVSLMLRMLFCLYAVYLGSKMAVYDLDTRQTQTTMIDQLANGVQTLRPADEFGDFGRRLAKTLDSSALDEDGLATITSQKFDFAISLSQEFNPRYFEMTAVSRNHFGDEFDLSLTRCNLTQTPELE